MASGASRNAAACAASSLTACSLVQHWKLQKAFEPSALLDGLLQHRCYAAAMRFAREFDATDATAPDAHSDVAYHLAAMSTPNDDPMHSSMDISPAPLQKTHNENNSSTYRQAKILSIHRSP
mgnify:CR=1 FL=1